MDLLESVVGSFLGIVRAAMAVATSGPQEIGMSTRSIDEQAPAGMPDVESHEILDDEEEEPVMASEVFEPIEARCAEEDPRNQVTE